MFSHDNTAILSGSHESVRVWNRSAQACIRTMASGYVLSAIFVPSDRQIVAGKKKGSLQIFDFAAAEMTEEVEEAHSKEVWCISLLADMKGFGRPWLITPG